VRGSIFLGSDGLASPRDAGAFEALSPVKRGPKVAAPNPLLTKRLERAEAIIEIQKNEFGSSGRLGR
jgi:hypothetical protein